MSNIFKLCPTYFSMGGGNYPPWLRAWFQAIEI